MKTFKFFACIKLVKGHKNSILIDVQSERLLVISTSLSEKIDKLHIDILEDENDLESGNFAKLIMYFVQNEWGFFTKDPLSFPELDLTFYNYSHISNLIIDVGSIDKVINYDIIESINYLLIQSLQFRVFYEIDILDIKKLLSKYNTSNLSSIEIVTISNRSIEVEDYEMVCREYAKLTKLILFNGNEDRMIEIRGKYIQIRSDSFDSHLYCGNIKKENFTGNIFSFTEAIKYNSCLNKKIGIDVNGELKNCPSMPVSFGNIKNTSLLEVIKKPEFKKYWSINKDKIHVCKDCEYRYICTDCRAYVEDPEDILSKPLKCGYNPYVGEWSEWSNNPLKQKAIHYYGMDELVAERAGRVKDEKLTSE